MQKAQSWNLTATTGYHFTVWQNRQLETWLYRVQVRNVDGTEFWLNEPEPAYETESGANYAILLFLERNRT